MIEVVILERKKDKNGVTVAYVLQNVSNESKFEMPAHAFEESVAFGTYAVLNAVAIKSGGFRGLHGHAVKIKTTVDMSLGVTECKPSEYVSSLPAAFPQDYYGKDFIDLCRKIRRLALQNKIVVDKASSDNMLKLIDSCGTDALTFTRGYLSIIQPYCLEFLQRGAHHSTDLICLANKIYRIVMTVKFQEDEDGVYLVASYQDMLLREECSFSDKLCAVIVDEVVNRSGEYIDIRFLLQLGFMRNWLNVAILSRYYDKGIALVPYKGINERYSDNMRGVLNDLQRTYFSSTYELGITLHPRGVSVAPFLNLGYTLISNICLLLDCFSIRTDAMDRKLLLDSTSNLLASASDDNLIELMYTLEQKYGSSGGYANLLYQQVMSICKEIADGT